MSDVVISYGHCVGCGLPFRFNRFRVPQIFIGGTRGPLCQRCLAHLNEVRTEAGLELIIALPDAYEPDLDARPQ